MALEHQPPGWNASRALSAAGNFADARVVTGVVASSFDMIAIGLKCEPTAKANNERSGG